ncbi:MAG: hypothetical protein PUK76_10965 [Treponema sp.]|nr:hypothetical protein [Treponema sp.]
MKKIILLGCVLLTTVCLTFADGTCKDHGDYSGSYCPTCEYNRGSNFGSSAANSGSAYNDKKCREVNRGNYIQSNWIDRENQNQVKDCVDGYKEAYGEREWCSTCKKYYPKGAHSHN